MFKYVLREDLLYYGTLGQDVLLHAVKAHSGVNVVVFKEIRENAHVARLNDQDLVKNNFV